jgi:hypothetical protein
MRHPYGTTYEELGEEIEYKELTACFAAVTRFTAFDPSGAADDWHSYI